jgi:hypothetical protein
MLEDTFIEFFIISYVICNNILSQALSRWWRLHLVFHFPKVLNKSHKFVLCFIFQLFKYRYSSFYAQSVYKLSLQQTTFLSLVNFRCRIHGNMIFHLWRELPSQIMGYLYIHSIHFWEPPTMQTRQLPTCSKSRRHLYPTDYWNTAQAHPTSGNS